MSLQFYKFAVSLTEKLQCESECYVKIHKSIRKFRRLYLSNVYLYVLSEDKIKFKVSALKVRKLISSLNSSEFVLLTDHKSLLIDDLALREKMKKELLELNPAIEIVYVKEPLLDEYAEGTKVDEKEETLTLNLVRLRNEYEEFGANKKEKHFYELYSSVDLVLKDEYFMLMTAEKKNEGKAEKKGFSLFKREKKEFFTVKVYLKKLIGQNCALREQILRERKCLEEVLSPYIPVLSKCMSSRSSIYCITDYYRGNLLSSYLENETLTKTQFKCLLSQIVMAIGQVHECNLVYNNANATSIFIIDEGYVLLNDFSKCCDLNTQATHEWMALLKDAVPPEGVEKASITGCWDWWNFGQLIYFIKEGKKWSTGISMPWEKEPDLCSLASGLLEAVPEKRLGYRNDYHQVLGHSYFKNINKKELATRTCEPLKKFFVANPQKIEYYSDGEDWSVNDSYLEDYEFNRQLQ